MKTLRFILTARLLIGCVAVWGLLQSYTPAASPEPAPDLGDLLQRIQAYTDTFYGEFGNCVLEEKYTQRLKGTDNRMQPVLQIRVLRADVLLVWVESAQQGPLPGRVRGGREGHPGARGPAAAAVPHRPGGTGRRHRRKRPV